MREEVVAGGASFEHSRISCNDDNQWGQSITNAASLPKVHKVIFIIMLSTLVHFMSNHNGNNLYHDGLIERLVAKYKVLTKTLLYMPNAGRSKLLQLIRWKARPRDPMVSVSKSNHRNELRTLCASSGSPGDRVWETGQKKCGFCPQLPPSPPHHHHHYHHPFPFVHPDLSNYDRHCDPVTTHMLSDFQY